MVLQEEGAPEPVTSGLLVPEQVGWFDDWMVM